MSGERAQLGGGTDDEATDWGPFDPTWVGGAETKIEVERHGATLVSLASGGQGYIAPGIPLEALEAFAKKLETRLARRERLEARRAELASAAGTSPPLADPGKTGRD